MNFNEIFEKLAKVNDRSVIWNNWLDYCIDYALLNPIQQKHDFKGYEKEYHEMLNEWLDKLSNTLEDKSVYDMLGEFYEDLVTSQSKSKNMGQFYTPSTITDLVNQLVINDDDKGMVNDCACGSGRMLLDAYVKSNGGLVCIGQDLDETSCKMTVLNFWSHGVVGSVLHMDSLTGQFYNAWRVNNYLYHGLHVPHIELVSERDAYRFIGLNNDIKSIEVNNDNTVIENNDNSKPKGTGHVSTEEQDELPKKEVQIKLM